jgi:hypothetical protein
MEPEELEGHGVSEHTGFPNAATDARLNALDLSKLLVRHPSSTFYMRVSGESGQDVGIFDGDIVVVDRALSAKKSDIVIWWDLESFAISIASQLPDQTIPWGVITHSIHAYRGIDTK